MRACCGNCKWHEYDECDMDYVCTNDLSGYYYDFTGDDDFCEEWEEDDD